MSANLGFTGSCAPFRYLWVVVVGLGLTATTPVKAKSSGRVIVPSLRTANVPTKAEKAKAAQHYAKLNRLYKRRRYARALPHAEAMWKLVPKPLSAEIFATLLMSPKVERPCDAFEVLLAAMDLPNTKPSSNMIGLLNKAAGDCAPSHGWARIVVEPSDAIVTISGVRIVAPRTVGLSSGNHTVITARSGYIKAEQTLNVMASTGATLQVSLQKEPTVVKTIVKEPAGGSPVTVPSVVAKSPPPKPPTAAYALIGTGAIATVTGATLFGLAVRNRDAHATIASDNPNPDANKLAEMETLKSEGQTFEIAAYVVGGLGLAVLTTGFIVLATHDDGGDSGAVGQVSPMMLPGGGGGVVWGGTF